VLERARRSLAERPSLARGLAFALLALIALVLYGGALEGSFYRDDFPLLLRARDTSFGEVLRSELLTVHRGQNEWFWRPGWWLLFDAMYGVFGATPRPYLVLGLVLFFGLACAIEGIVARESGSHGTGVLAGLLFLSTPAPVEAVLWPAASFMVLPAAILILAGGMQCLEFLRHGRTRALVLGLLAMGASLYFREAAYHAPLFVLGAWLASGKERRGTWKRLLILEAGLVLLVLVHALAVPTPPEIGELSPGELARSTLANGATTVRLLAPLRLPDAALLGAALVGSLGLWTAGGRTTRTFLLWAWAALFPYVVVAAVSRASLFVVVPLAMALALGARDLALRLRERRLAFLPAAALLGIVLLQVPPLRAAQRALHREGELARATLAGFSRIDVARFDRLYVGFLPGPYTDCIGAMAELALGPGRDVRELWVVSRPPFVFHDSNAVDPGAFYDWLPPEPDERTGYLEIDPLDGTQRLRSRAELFPAQGIAVPIFAFRHGARVASAEEAASTLGAPGWSPAQAVVLTEPTALELDPADAGSNRVLRRKRSPPRFVLEVECETDCLFVTAYFVLVGASAPRASVDGRAARLLDADGMLHALELRRGPHAIVLDPGS
jgi:hypothetical protein